MTAKIAIASTLKPVIEPRAYEKIGKSLANSGHYEIHIIGSLPTTDLVPVNIMLYPIAKTSGAIARILTPWKILITLSKIKPEALIICTHELLLIGTLYKLFTGSKLIYDIQENYFFNLLYQNNYPRLLRYLLAFYVRLKEVLLANFINYFLLAEQCYVDELNFIKQRYSIIENKFIASETKIKKQNQLPTEFLITGTISKEYGVFDALHFFIQLPTSKCKLIIVGHCPNQHTLRALKKVVKGIDNINLSVSSTPIPSKDILSYIGEHSIGLLPYQTNKSTQNKIPTKLYEYIGLGIPILISPNPLWDKIIERYHAGLSIDFKSPISIDEIRQRLTLIQQGQVIDLKDIMWINEEAKLLTIFHGLFS